MQKRTYLLLQVGFAFSAAGLLIQLLFSDSTNATMSIIYIVVICVLLACNAGVWNSYRRNR